MSILRVSFRTLGCKLNQFETESIADAFAEAGASIRGPDEPADLYVVNTCTVTGKAEQKARHAVRHALARNPDAVVLATGCYAQMDPVGLSLVHPRALVLPGDEKSSLLSLASWLQDNWQGHGDLRDAVAEWIAGIEGAADAAGAGSGPDAARSRAAVDPFAYRPKTFAFHSRPALKVQDGCNNRCTYCRVCLARGPAVSLPSARILERVLELERAGKGEVVLTGINLAQYRDGSMRFPDLLLFLAGRTERIRFRLSSYEPEYVDDAFLRAFSDPRVQPHVHLSVQSGSDAVLRRMARPYGAARVAEAARALRAARRDPFLAADLITGFPGETDAEFEETYSLFRELDFAWIHAFPFSARPGTAAFAMKPKVPERVSGERVARLTELARAGKARYVERWIGEPLELILERGAAGEDSVEADAEFAPAGEPRPEAEPRAALRVGTTGNYLKAGVREAPESASDGDVLRVVLEKGSCEAGLDAVGRCLGPEIMR